MAFEGARVYHSADQTVTNTTWLYVAFDSERRDDNSYHDTSTNNSRLTAPADGWYIFGGTIQFDANTTEVWRVAGLHLNRTTEVGHHVVNPTVAGVNTLSVSAAWYLTAGDYVELGAYQNSGGNLDVKASGNYSPEFWIYRLGADTDLSGGARVYHSSNQTITTATDTDLSFDSIERDDGGFFQAGTSQMKARWDGWYHLGAMVDTTSFGNYTHLRLTLNNSTVIAEQHSSGTNENVLEVSTLYYLTRNDTISVSFQQNSGSDKVATANGHSPYFWMVRV